MSSTKKMCEVETEDEEDPDFVVEIKRSSARKPPKFKEEENEYVPNCSSYSYYGNATAETLACPHASFHEIAALSNALSKETKSKRKPKSKAEDSNGCASTKKKRGRPRKRQGAVRQGPSSMKTEEKYVDVVDVESSPREPPKKLYYNRVNSNWGHEKFDCKENESKWEEPKAYCQKYLTESSSKPSQAVYPTLVKQEDEYGFYRRNDYIYHQMDRNPLTEVPEQLLEEGNFNDSPSTSTQKELLPLFVTYPRNDSRGNEVGEIYYTNKREDYHCENRSDEKLHGNYSANLDGAQNQNYREDQLEMNQNECTNKGFSFSNYYMPPKYLVSNSNSELQKLSTGKPSGSSHSSLSGKTAVSVLDRPDYQGQNLSNKFDQIHLNSNISGKDNSALFEGIPMHSLPPPASSSANVNKVSSEFDYEVYLQKLNNSSSADLRDNRDGGKNNLKESTVIGKIQKSSQLLAILAPSSDFLGNSNVPSNTQELKFDSSPSSTNSDHTYCLEKEKNYTLLDSNAKPENLLTMPESSKNVTPNEIYDQLSVPGNKYPDGMNEFVNPPSSGTNHIPNGVFRMDQSRPNSNISSSENFQPHQDGPIPDDKNELVYLGSYPNGMKHVPNGVFGMEQSWKTSNIPSSENFQSHRGSSVPAIEPNTLSDVFGNANHDFIDHVNKLDFSYYRSVENQENLLVLPEELDVDFQSATDHFFSREGKPLQFVEFLRQRFFEGKLYSFCPANENDIVVRGCAADFNEWLNRKPRL